MELLKDPRSEMEGESKPINEESPSVDFLGNRHKNPRLPKKNLEKQECNCRNAHFNNSNLVNAKHRQIHENIIEHLFS